MDDKYTREELFDMTTRELVEIIVDMQESHEYLRGEYQRILDQYQRKIDAL